MKFLKKLFCRHQDILTITESQVSNFVIVKSKIECQSCFKTFAQHPNAQCCYVMHLHGELLKEKFIAEYNKYKQQIGN